MNDDVFLITSLQQQTQMIVRVNDCTICSPQHPREKKTQKNMIFEIIFLASIFCLINCFWICGA